MRWKLALKTLGVIGRGYRRFCREAAIQNSPGLQPWVARIEARALKVAPDVGGLGGRNAPLPEHAFRTPLSGRINALHNPGLKPWPNLYNRCAVNPAGYAGRTTPRLQHSSNPFARIRGRVGKGRLAN